RRRSRGRRSHPRAPRHAPLVRPVRRSPHPGDPAVSGRLGLDAALHEHRGRSRISAGVLPARLLSVVHPRVTSGPPAHGVAVILLDIEGTTRPIAFVYDVLFPYARERLYPYLRAHFVEDRVRDLLTTLRVEWQDDARAKQEPPPWALADIPAAARYLEWLMDRDRKSPSLKRLQGEIWAEGFRDGTLRGDVFADVPPALRRWRAAGLGVAIYSSG